VTQQADRVLTLSPASHRHRSAWLESARYLCDHTARNRRQSCRRVGSALRRIVCKRQLGLAGMLGEPGPGCATGLVLALDVGSTAAMIGVTKCMWRLEPATRFWSPIWLSSIRDNGGCRSIAVACRHSWRLRRRWRRTHWAERACGVFGGQVLPITSLLEPCFQGLGRWGGAAPWGLVSPAVLDAGHS
jgi:hypothetical protein